MTKSRFAGSAATVLALALLHLPAAAHNVLGGVYAVDNVIEGEAGFSNGDMAKPGTLVEVRKASGEPLGLVNTEEFGFFQFEARQRIDHHFHIDMGSGHVLELVLSADELPARLATGAQPAHQAESQLGAQAERAADSDAMTDSKLSSAVDAVDQTELQRLIETAVARQVQPLRKELAAYKEKAGLRDVLGGIGYIFGLCGIGIWLQQRRTQTPDT